MFLICVDAHSKWPEVIEMSKTTATRTIAELRKLFADNGLPEQIVTDNGPQFTSDEFSLFFRSNGVKHIRCSPYHPVFWIKFTSTIVFKLTVPSMHHTLRLT